jgi:2-iminoacetate synthase
MTASGGAIVDEARIRQAIERGDVRDAGRVRDVLARAVGLGGLEMEDVATLAAVSDPELLGEVFDAARRVKERIYGSRLVLFAPLYASNLCANDCLYCAFRTANEGLRRRALSTEEISREVEILVEQGHRRVLLVAGEAYPEEGFRYVLEAVGAIYGVKRGSAEIRRVNVNVAPLSVEEFRRLRGAGIGTYQLFQETYHRPTYERVHLRGRKRDYGWRLETMDRAMEAGIDDVGIGVLFGLYDWRFEILALMQHIRHLESRHGVGPHTVSVPRLEPAAGSELASQPYRPVDDVSFRKIVAILRLAVPYTGIILSTRETPHIRRESFALGVSQISAGSRTHPGGYAADRDESDCSQFQLGDHRPLDEVIRDVARLGYMPSFCTACYRLGRTGEDFMELAKPGEIRLHCAPNGVATFLEYLLDHASPETREAGESLIADELARMEPDERRVTERLVGAIREGRRDVFT